MRRGLKQESKQEKPFSDADKQAIRRALSTPDGKVLLKFLKASGKVEVSTYRKGATYEDMIDHGARKALVSELIQIMEA